jgi:hypothetical protein
MPMDFVKVKRLMKDYEQPVAVLMVDRVSWDWTILQSINRR